MRIRRREASRLRIQTTRSEVIPHVDALRLLFQHRIAHAPNELQLLLHLRLTTLLTIRARPLAWRTLRRPRHARQAVRIWNLNIIRAMHRPTLFRFRRVVQHRKSKSLVGVIQLRVFVLVFGTLLFAFARLEPVVVRHDRRPTRGSVKVRVARTTEFGLVVRADVVVQIGSPSLGRLSLVCVRKTTDLPLCFPMISSSSRFFASSSTCSAILLLLLRLLGFAPP